MSHPFLGTLLAALTSCSLGMIAGCGGTGSSASDGTGGAGAGAGTSAGGAATAAGGSGTGAGQPSAAELYGPGIKTIVLEVDYATGAEPYTGAIVGMGDTWDLFDQNANRLFEGSGKTLVVPHTLAEMEELADVAGDEFDTTAVLAIADAHRTTPSSGDQASIYVVWLPGYYKDKDGVQNQVLGISLWDTGIIAMFKPVIDSGGAPGTVVPRFVEQTTLVHEFGHAAGLVDNGISMAAPHKDDAHGAHCTNPDCVMYYLNEGASDMLAFVQDAITKGDTDLYGQECLDDAKAAIGP